MKKVLLAGLAALTILAGCSSASSGLNSESKKIDFEGISCNIPADAESVDSASSKQNAFADYRIPCSKDYDLYITCQNIGNVQISSQKDADNYIGSMVLENLMKYELVKEEKIDGFAGPLFIYKIDSSPETATDSTYPFSYYLLVQGTKGSYVMTISGDFSQEIDKSPKKEVIAALKPDVEQKLDQLCNSLVASLSVSGESGSAK